MDSLFDEGQDEVGSEIEAYCPSPRCKADTNHTIVTMYEDEIRRVQCAVCGDVHAYRKPRGESYDTPPQPAPKLRAGGKKPSWEEAMAGVSQEDLANCRPYSIRDTYEYLDVVSHPSFDIGFVTDLLPDNKVEISFKDDRRVLVHNRSDLAEKMPEIADLPAPRERRRKRKKAKMNSALAQRLLQQRVKDATKRKDFEETAAQKLATAERAAEARRELAAQLASEDITDPEMARQIANQQEKERKRREREAERERKRLEREADREEKRIARDKERERKRIEREKDREKKSKERDKLRIKKEKERERLKAKKEKERLKKQKQREKIAAKREKERERKQAQRDKIAAKREKDRKKKDKLRKVKDKKRKAVAKKKAAALKKKKKAAALKKKKAAALKKKSARRTGGKKTVAARKRPAKKAAKRKPARRVPKRKPASRKPKKRRRR